MATSNIGLKLETFTTGISTLGSAATSLNYYGDIVDNICILSMDVSTGALSENAWKLIGTLPEGKRPKHKYYFSSKNAIWTVNTNGQIQVYSPWGGITLSVEYVEFVFVIGG